MLVATAGHVDHGKTSLIQALTGTNTDRLAEEQQRGLTIELGYAFSEAGTNKTIGFIDVPGHHRFINTMISGINGIDLGILVVAADDGPMPQTLEHLQLLRLLGVKRFTGVITKIDLVDREQLDSIIQQTSELIPGAPLCEISNRTGEGLNELGLLLNEQLQDLPRQTTEKQFRMYIDRVFIKKGAGVIVTGTCLAGSVNTGDELKLHSSVGNNQEIKVRVREIHAQGKAADSGRAGQRCALNISGKVSLERVHRGDFLCMHPTAQPNYRLDTRCWRIEGSKRSFKLLGRVKLYLGTRRIGARTYLLDREEKSLSAQRIQLILDKKLLAFAGDRFVLRDDNESTTLGGGVVIDPEAPKWGKSRRSRSQQLDALELGKPSPAIEHLLFKNGGIVSLAQCKRLWKLSSEEVEELLAQPSFNAGDLIRTRTGVDEFLLSRELWVSHLIYLEQALAEWHSTRPMEPGMAPEILQKLVRPQIPENLFKVLLDDHIRVGKVIHHEQLIRAMGHKPTLSPQVQRDWQRLVTTMKARGLNVPLRSELMKDTGFDSRQLELLTRPAIKSGNLFEIGEKRLVLPATLKELAGLLKQFTDVADGVSVIEAKRVFGLGRNLTIEILEFFDKIGYTKRAENTRDISNPRAVELMQ